MNRIDELINLVPDGANVLICKDDNFTAKLSASKKLGEVYNTLEDIKQNWFDVAIDTGFLSKLPKPEQIIVGIKGALKPSGTFYILVGKDTLSVPRMTDILNEAGCVYTYDSTDNDTLYTVKYKPNIEKKQRVGLAIGVIAMGTVPTKWWQHLMQWTKTIPGGVFWNFIVVEGKYYDVARQEVVQKAYNMGVEYLFFLDSDVFPPSDCLQKLMSYNVDIVNGVYWMKTYPPQPVVYQVLGNGPIWDIDPSEDLVEIGGSGLGCTLIKMSVFDKMQPPYFKCNWSMVTDGRLIHSDIGEDHYFYIKAREAGFKIWMAPSVLCDHFDVKNDKFYPDPEVIRKISATKLRKLGQSHMLQRLGTSINKKQKIIFCTSMGCPFNGNSIQEKPIAGSETAVIHMANQMKRLGHQVKVYCNCDKEGTYNGVEYLSYEKYDTKEECDIFISSRCVDIFYTRPNARTTILWCHDMPIGWAWTNLKFVHPHIDYIMGVSQFHVNEISKTFPFIPISKFVVTSNGVDISRFEHPIEKNRKKLLYATTPFRGLDVLLDVWPRIHSEVPDAELYIYSGMAIYDMPEPQEFLDMYKKAEAMPGVHYSKSIPQSEIAKEHLSAGIYVYPSHFKETSCISAMEAITAGTPVVTTNAGALPETVGNCGILIDGESKSLQYKDSFVKAVVKLLKDDTEYNKYTENCEKRNFSWDNVGKQWNRRFCGDENPNTPDFWNGVWQKKVLEDSFPENIPEKWAVMSKYIDNEDTVLDYGAGVGLFLKYLSDNGKGKSLDGYDYSTYAMHAMQEIPHVGVMQGKYDVVVAANVIECTDDPNTFIDKLKEHSHYGGDIIISITENQESVHVYNKFDYSTFIALLNKHFNKYRLEFYEKDIIAVCINDSVA